MAVLALARERLPISDEAQAHAESLEARGLGALDALHLAVASGANADYFATCDDRLLKKAQQLQGLACKIVSVLGLVSEVTK